MISGDGIKKRGDFGFRIDHFSFFPKRNKNGLGNVFGKCFIEKGIQDKRIDLIVIVMEKVFEGLFISLPQKTKDIRMYMDCFAFQCVLTLLIKDKGI
jgi:hypothetical protein